MTEQRYVLGIAYKAGPDERIVKGKDGGRDFFSEVELEKAAWSLLQSGAPAAGLFHLAGTEGHASIVESYIYRGDAWTLTAANGEQVTVNKGDWLVGLLLDDLAWQMYKDGKLGGLSPQGKAKRRNKVTA